MARTARLAGSLAAFAVAVWAVHAGWTQLRVVWDTPTPAGWVAVVGYLLVFLAAFLYLGFWQYAADRAAGRVRRPLGLYERFYRRMKTED